MQVELFTVSERVEMLGPGNFNIINRVRNIGFLEFPVKHPPVLHVLIELGLQPSELRCDHELRLALIDQDGRSWAEIPPILLKGRHVESKQGYFVTCAHVPARFEAPGDYTVQLLSNGAILASTTLHASLVKAA